MTDKRTNVSPSVSIRVPLVRELDELQEKIEDIQTTAQLKPIEQLQAILTLLDADKLLDDVPVDEVEEIGQNITMVISGKKITGQRLV